MADSPIQQFLNYPYRNWVVGGATVLLMLLISLPAWEQVSELRTELNEVEEQIEEITHSVTNLEPLRKRVAQLKAVAAKNDDTINEEKALNLREQVVQIIHDRDCQLLNIQLGSPQTAPWYEDEDPMAAEASVRDEEAQFQIIKTKLSVAAQGELPKVTKLVDHLTALHDFAVPTRMNLQQKGDEETLEVEIDLTLLDLRRIEVEEDDS